jgi:hypothetical protein
MNHISSRAAVNATPSFNLVSVDLNETGKIFGVQQVSLGRDYTGGLLDWYIIPV